MSHNPITKEYKTTDSEAFQKLVDFDNAPRESKSNIKNEQYSIQRGKELLKNFKFNEEHEKPRLSPEDRAIAEKVWDKFGNAFVNLAEDKKEDE